jgi:hypothetical protein
MSVDLVPSCCNNECLSMCVLIEIRLFTQKLKFFAYDYQILG